MRCAWAGMLGVAALIGCTAAVGPSVPSVSPAPTFATGSASPTQTARVLRAGTLVRTEAIQRDQGTFFADLGSLYAVASRDAPAPFDSKVQRFDPRASTWEDVFEDDAFFRALAPSSGRAAIVEYREVPQSGGAFDERVIVLDLASRATVAIDAYALSAKTYRGGGGGPRRPAGNVAIGGNTVAWTRLNELAGGVIEGELRVATIGNAIASVTIARSRESVAPLWVDDATLLYLVGGSTRDDLRVRDLRTGADRSVATLTAPDVSMGPGGIARSGDLIGWIENAPLATAASAPPSPRTTALLRTLDLRTGATRELDLPAPYCVGLSGNAFGFTWDCRSSSKSVPTSLSYFDPLAWRDVELVASADRPNSLQAFAGSFLWFDVPSGTRRVNLLTVSP